MDKKNTMLLTVIAIATLLVAVVGATFAYFSVTASNQATATTATGTAKSSGAITFATVTSTLQLNLDATQMAQAAHGTTYYASLDGTAALAENGVFDLATATVASGDTKYDCTYSYKVTGTINATVIDNSDEDVKVIITGGSITGGTKTYTLKQILAAGATGLSFTGKFENLTTGTPQKLQISSTVTNTNEEQNGLAGNGYTITVTPTAGVTGQGFVCTAVS